MHLRYDQCRHRRRPRGCRGDRQGGRWWFDVDGAYGGSGIFARSLKPKYAGLELAHSFILDPHKWLFSPFDCCAVLYREPELARAVHTQDASYLDVIHVSDGEWNPTDYAYHLTRRARGLPLWFSLAVYGVDAYREAIEVAVRLARNTADLVKRAPQLERTASPTWESCCSAGWAGGPRTTIPGRPAPRRRSGIHPAEQVGRRDSRPVRVPAPGHQPGPGERGPGTDRVMAE